MSSPAFTNTSISNAYRGADQVSKILLGYNHVWPLQSVFSFDTYQAGGELNFRVVSDTQYVACIINDATIFLYQSNVADGTDVIRAINLDAQAYNNLYQIDSTVSMTDITLPLYQRKQVKITGRGTQLARYGADYNNGNILVEINNEYGSAINYTVSVTGKVSITKTCPVGERTLFSFTAMSRGVKTVTINNLTDNLVDTIPVTINTSYTPIPTQIINIGDQAVSEAISETLTTVKVYCLTEEEAVANGLVILDPSTDPINTPERRQSTDHEFRARVYTLPGFANYLTLGNTTQNYQYPLINIPATVIENLIFNNGDLEGNIHAVDLKDVNINIVTSMTQRKLQTIRSNFINTSTNKTINSNVKIINNPAFKSMHGPEVTYRYPGEYILGLRPKGAKLIPVGATANNYTIRFRIANMTGKDYGLRMILNVFDVQGNVVSNSISLTGMAWSDNYQNGPYDWPQSTAFEYTVSFGQLTHTVEQPLFIGFVSNADLPALPNDLYNYATEQYDGDTLYIYDLKIVSPTSPGHVPLVEYGDIPY